MPRQLQVNLIRSHAAGVGHPLSVKHTRMLFVSEDKHLGKRLQWNLTKDVKTACSSPLMVLWGASGDLAPLSHLSLGLLGEGQMWSPKSGWADAGLVLKAHGLTPLELQPKEGLALINGTQLITSLGAEAVERARLIAKA
ncbi:hypothetical protein OS493_038842, partial [Desmophyllum pertusum]